MNSLQSNLLSVDYSKNPDKLFEICHTVLNIHALKKKSMYVGIIRLL